MTIQAQEFWLTTPLNAVNTLMDRTFSWAQDNDDLADMYLEDLNDFKKAVGMFRNSDGEGIAKLIDNMDTSPREELVLAFASDCGKDWVRSYLGYELS